ncbi:Inositol-trisphosphate 3-kinase A [Chionoecetes opilio]|uniref:Kinase n=1 Tax=Chionoecetes opilio TaxID=41210 RepID=A0A8J4XVM9_CHIOP|nr:Inositol-trisphosphate 3-kinase A [Chionoecetes opilio]
MAVQLLLVNQSCQSLPVAPCHVRFLTCNLYVPFTRPLSSLHIHPLSPLPTHPSPLLSLHTHPVSSLTHSRIIRFMLVLIGSSLLFVHNDTSALVRMIDFAKTVPLPQGVGITHRSPWSEGTHEDGYLLGLDKLIDIFTALEKVTVSPPNGTLSNKTSTTTPPTPTTKPSTTTPTTTSTPIQRLPPTPAKTLTPQKKPHDGGSDVVGGVTANVVKLPTLGNVSSASSTTTTSDHHHHNHPHPSAPPPVASAPSPAPPT